MARPLRGTMRRVATGWQVEVPAASGSTRRVQRTFATKAAAQRWQRAAVAALSCGGPLPATPAAPGPQAAATPPVAATAPVPPAAPAAAGSAPVSFRGADGAATVFEQVALDWHHLTYRQLERAGAARDADVLSILRLHLFPFAAAHGLADGGDWTLHHYSDFLTSLARVDDPDAAAGGPDAPLPDPDELLDVAAACAATGACQSTLRRRIAAGTFPGSLVDAAGRRMIPRRDLAAAGLLAADGAQRPPRRGARVVGGYSQAFIADARRVLDRVLLHGVQLQVWSLRFDPAAAQSALTRRPKTPARVPPTMAQTARMAAHLHPVHQAVLWQLRILGLRISEAYGPSTDDLIPQGDGRGLLVIARQGGRRFRARRDGRTVSTGHSDTLKTDTSRRVMVVPAPLMSLLGVVVDVFHTDPATGQVIPGRLVPGLREAGSGGQQAFRTALRAAALAEGIDLSRDLDTALLPRPHDLRKANVTDLAWSDVPDLVGKRWAGHAAGDDVHHRRYVLDHPTLAPLRAAAEELERLLAEAGLASLMVPTAHRCTTGYQPAMAADAGRIDAALAAVGWLVLPEADGEPLLSAAEVATELGVAPATARRWLREGRLPRVPMPGRRRDTHAARLADVIAAKDDLAGLAPLADVAADLDVPLTRLRGWVERGRHAVTVSLGEACLRPDAVDALRQVADRERRLRADGLTVAEAAAELSTDTRAVDRLVATGRLRLLEGRGADGLRYVDRGSVEALRQDWSPIHTGRARRRHRPAHGTGSAS